MTRFLSIGAVRTPRHGTSQTTLRARSIVFFLMSLRSSVCWSLLHLSRPILSRAPKSTRLADLASRLLTYEVLRAAPQPLRRSTVNGASFELRLNDYVEAKAWLTGTMDPDVAAFCRQHLGRGGTALDVGANIGFISVPLGKHAREIGARIIAVEALPENARRLQNYVEVNGVAGIVSIVSTAAGAAAGSVELAVDRTSGFTTNGVIGAALRTDSLVTEVPVRTLDEICREHAVEHIDVLKIDVEGFEPFVIQGAAELFAAGRVGAGVMEINEFHLLRNGWSRQKVLALLTELDLEPYSLLGGVSPAVDFNVAFRPRS